MSDDKLEQQTTTIGSFLTSNIRNYSMILMLAVIMIIFAFMTHGVNLNSRNITNIFMQNSYILLLAVGMMLVIILGNIDLSVGSFIALTGAFSAMLYNTGIGMIPTIILSILIGIAIGDFQGIWIAYFKIPAFIVTLAGMLLFRGVTILVTAVTPISLKDDGFKQIASGTANIPALTIGNIYYTALLFGAILYIIYIISEIISRNNKKHNNFEILPWGLFIAKIILIGSFYRRLELEIRHIPRYSR